jgi:hypothetical protein
MKRPTAGPRPLVVAGLPPAALELRESPRARRLTLRVDPGRDVIQVVVPAGVGEAEAARFVLRNADWVRSRLAAMPPHLPFAAGAVVPVLGIDHVIRHDPAIAAAPAGRTAKSGSAATPTSWPGASATISPPRRASNWPTAPAARPP